MKNIGVTACQSRSKAQFCLIVIILLLIVFLFLHSEKVIHHHYQESQQNQLVNSAPVTSRYPASNRSYNLMEENVSPGQESQGNSECSLDYMNSQKLPQDHPCVIETIRQHYLNKPSPPSIPLKLDSDDDKDRSPGQTGVILRLLKNKTDGFFVECGALNGEYMSNSLDLERKYNWSGILIEANPITFQKLLSRNRKAWTLPICLSLEPYPTEVIFQPKSGDPGHSHIEADTLQKPGIPGVDPDAVKVQCFPFYSVLLAVGRTDVDFFSLDVEGHELQILKTIPWHKVDIKTLTVEWDHIPEGQEALSRFLEDSGFMRIGAFDFQFTRDVIFVKDLINI
ncbi:protein Star-like [Daphnia carinata]|uniref:protein Star-like n=1 Tax=Daphnia carinata TaxID=120202 RepID=UPI00257B83DF|nr:protein Star-like [Daphnia carinata]